MMLSENVKQQLIQGIQKSSDSVRAHCALIGPAGTVQWLIDGDTGERVVSELLAELAANRAEAEQIVAGVLGLM